MTPAVKVITVRLKTAVQYKQAVNLYVHIKCQIPHKKGTTLRSFAVKKGRPQKVNDTCMTRKWLQKKQDVHACVLGSDPRPFPNRVQPRTVSTHSVRNISYRKNKFNKNISTIRTSSVQYRYGENEFGNIGQQCSKNEFRKKYQYSKNELLKQYQ